MATLVVESDYHCGHLVGLTPPDWWYNLSTPHPPTEKAAKHQRELWNWRMKALKKVGHINFLVVNGDLIEGKGQRSGGTELTTADRNEQCEMAAEAIDAVKADEVGIIRGTPYHTGKDEDWEDVIAKTCKTPVAFIGNQEWLEYRGVTFDFKHKIGGSSIPHGRFTAAARAKLWNKLWAIRQQQPDADVLIRSHVHYHTFCGEGDYMVVTTPGLQGYGSKYGTKQCEGTVDIGLLVFDVEDGAYSWQAELGDLDQQHAKLVKR